MAQPSFDPGLTQQYAGNLRRAINKDGSFNVDRQGSSWRDIHPYLHLINASWPVFFSYVLAGYTFVNIVFALIYFRLPAGDIQGTQHGTHWQAFLDDFFFSAHTLTTVGYGNFAPVSNAANFIAAFEAIVGLMGFALATGLLFGRVSKPSARIGFSDNALIAPYLNKTSVQFRIVNLRSNTLIEMQAIVVLMTVEGPDHTRIFQALSLERTSIYFFPLTWTVVHPIDESSPLYGKTAADLERSQAEIMIIVKGFDDTFSQTVNARYSYRFDELVWNAKFKPAFRVGDGGTLVLEVNRVGDFQLVSGE